MGRISSPPGSAHRSERAGAPWQRPRGRSAALELTRDTIGGLSNEVKGKLKAARPATFGAAARISGVTPAALTALLRFVRRTARNEAAVNP